MNRSLKTPFAVLACVVVVGMAIGTPMLHPDADGPVEESQAIAPAIVAGVAIGGAVVGGIIGNELCDIGWTCGQSDDVVKDDEQTDTDLALTIETVKESSASLHRSKTESNYWLKQYIEGTTGNQMDRTAFQKARVTYVETMNNGSSKPPEAEVRDAVNKTLDDFYANQQQNLINTNNHAVARLAYLNSVIKGHPDWVTSEQMLYTQKYDNQEGSIMIGSASTTLTDGSSATHRFPFTGGTGNFTLTEDHNTGTSSSWNQTKFHYDSDGSGTWDSAVTTYNLSQSHNNWERLKDSHQVATSNINLLVDSTYADYAQGDLNDSQIMGPGAMYQELSTDGNSTQQGQAALALANMGHNGSLETQIQLKGLNDSRGQTWYNGTLFTNWQPADTNGEFKTGGVYTPHTQTHSHTLETGTPHADATQQEMVFVATDSGDILGVNETFEVHTIYDVETGDEVTNVTTIEHVTKNINKSSLDPAVFDELAALQEKLDRIDSGGASGGSLAFLEGITPEQAALGAGAGIGGLYVINRMTNPAARRRRR